MTRTTNICRDIFNLTALDLHLPLFVIRISYSEYELPILASEIRLRRPDSRYKKDKSSRRRGDLAICGMSPHKLLAWALRLVFLVSMSCLSLNSYPMHSG